MKSLSFSIYDRKQEEYHLNKTKCVAFMYIKSRDRLFRAALEVHEVARNQAPSSLVLCYL